MKVFVTNSSLHTNNNVVVQVVVNPNESFNAMWVTQFKEIEQFPISVFVCFIA